MVELDQFKYAEQLRKTHDRTEGFTLTWLQRRSGSKN